MKDGNMDALQSWKDIHTTKNYNTILFFYMNNYQLINYEEWLEKKIIKKHKNVCNKISLKFYAHILIHTKGMSA